MRKLPLVTDPISGIKRRMTRGELLVYRQAIRTLGSENADSQIDLWLDQARLVGEIGESKRDASGIGNLGY